MQSSESKSGDIREVHEGGVAFTVEVHRDGRLRKSARWSVHNDVVVVRAPRFLSDGQIDELLKDIVAKVLRQRKRARRQHDEDLNQRAQKINRQYFDGELQWHTIRWVKNMRKRLGSCSAGGATDGDIRISERIRDWPGFVVDYVIAHELAHRKHPNHSRAFWAYLTRYPQMERARGFIEGVAFAEHVDADDWL